HRPCSCSSFPFTLPPPSALSTLSLHDALPIYWSGSDPDVIYCHSGMKILSYNVVSNTYTLVHDFTGEAPGANLFQMAKSIDDNRSEEHTSELQSLTNLVCRLLLEKKKTHTTHH